MRTKRSRQIPWALLRAKKLVALDAETTGHSPRFGEKVIEIGASSVDRRGRRERFDTLVNGGVRVRNRTFHGITNAMLTNAPRFLHVLPCLRDLLDGPGVLVVAHNYGPAEQRFFTAQIAELGGVFAVRALCTLKLAYRLRPDLTCHQLSCLAEEYGLDAPIHTAGGDADVALALLLALLDENADRPDLAVVVEQACDEPTAEAVWPVLLAGRRIPLLPRGDSGARGSRTCACGIRRRIKVRKA